MSIFTNTDWRAKVAAMTEPDDMDTEKAFADMAFGFVANKLGDLMKDSHRIGFEVVKKNEDNTRMLGIFAFKADQKLLFAPVFFLNGEIKGPLLYRCDTQRFVPANKDWASYLIDNIDQGDGEGIAKSKSRNGNDKRVMMERMMNHPKSASIKAAAVEEFGEDVEVGIKKAMIVQSGILKEFLGEPDVGAPAAELIEKASSTEGSFEFVRLLSKTYPTAADVLPESFLRTEKKAADSHNLEIVYDFCKKAADAGGAKQYWRDGFFLFDNRYLKDTCKAYVVDNEDDITTVGEAGVYSIMRRDGTLEKGVTCLPFRYTTAPLCPRPIGCDQSEREIQGPDVYLFVKDGKIAASKEKLVLGIREGGKVEGSRTLERGKVYVPYVEGAESAGNPFYVEHVRKIGSVQYATCTPVESPCGLGAFPAEIYVGCWLDHEVSMLSSGVVESSVGDRRIEVVVNPDVSSSRSDRNEYGANAVFIPLKDKSAALSGHYTFDVLENLAVNVGQDDWIFGRFNMPTVKIDFDKRASRYVFTDVMSGEASDRLSRKEALIKLSCSLNLPAAHAYELLDMAEGNGSVAFRVAGLGLDKRASMLRIVGRPQWSESDVSPTGLPMAPVSQKVVLGIEGDQDWPEPPHIGDALDPTKPTGLPAMTIVSADPLDLRDIADTYKLPHVFEHGVVGTLASTFDAGKLISKYVPKFEDALDALGRTLFLFYWKPEDFERQYGQDDMANLEAQLESEYAAFGALTLELLKKSDKQKYSERKPGDLV